MYTPPAFIEADQEEIRKVIADYPLALIAHATAGLIEAQHIPLIFDGQARLIGHLAANNGICESLASGSDVLAVFSGQESYISPNWYPTKRTHHRHVPTWNYQAVHIRGKLNFLSDAQSALAVVGKLTKHFETRTNGKDGWKIADAPKEFIADLLTKIRPFEIQIEEIIAKSKLSQNRAQADYRAVADQMQRASRPQLAERMRKFEGQLFRTKGQTDGEV